MLAPTHRLATQRPPRRGGHRDATLLEAVGEGADDEPTEEAADGNQAPTPHRRLARQALDTFQEAVNASTAWAELRDSSPELSEATDDLGAAAG